MITHPGAGTGAVAPSNADVTTFTVTGVDQPEPIARTTHLVFAASGGWGVNGTSQWWTPGSVPLVTADALGRRTQLGDRNTGDACSVRVADRVAVVVRCGPVA
jgi:hypothetical protein